MDFPEEEFSEPDQACSVDTDNRNSEKGLRVSKTARLQKRAATDKVSVKAFLQRLHNTVMTVFTI